MVFVAIEQIEAFTCIFNANARKFSNLFIVVFTVFYNKNNAFLPGNEVYGDKRFILIADAMFKCILYE